MSEIEFSLESDGYIDDDPLRPDTALSSHHYGELFNLPSPLASTSPRSKEKNESTSFETYVPFQISEYHSPEIKSLINLVNVNINVYNANSQKFINFMNTIEKQFDVIQNNLKQIFVNIKKLVGRIVIVENNYDMMKYQQLENIVKRASNDYVHLLRRRASSLRRYSEHLEKIQRQAAQLLKKTSWILRKGYFDLQLADHTFYDTSNEISNFIIYERGVNYIVKLITRETNQLRKAVTEPFNGHSLQL